MGVRLRATALIVTTAVVTLSSAANAHYNHRAVQGEHGYGIRWCSAPSVWGLYYYYPCGRYRYYHRYARL